MKKEKKFPTDIENTTYGFREQSNTDGCCANMKEKKS